MKNRVIFIVKIIAVIAILFTDSYYWLRTVILHFGARLRYGCLWLFRRGQKVSYRQIRYGPGDFNAIDHADNNLVNGFLDFFVITVILILITK